MAANRSRGSLRERDSWQGQKEVLTKKSLVFRGRGYGAV